MNQVKHKIFHYFQLYLKHDCKYVFQNLWINNQFLIFSMTARGLLLVANVSRQADSLVLERMSKPIKLGCKSPLLQHLVDQKGGFSSQMSHFILPARVLFFSLSQRMLLGNYIYHIHIGLSYFTWLKIVLETFF